MPGGGAPMVSEAQAALPGASEAPWTPKPPRNPAYADPGRPVTDETVTWSGPGVRAGTPSYRATFTVPAEPGEHTISASGTVKWSFVRKTAAGRRTNQESESATGTFTIVVE